MVNTYMNIRKKLLKQYLNWFWLRPESAILLALRGAAYHDTLKFFDKSSLDVSCGDGMFSFPDQIKKNLDLFRSPTHFLEPEINDID